MEQLLFRNRREFRRDEVIIKDCQLMISCHVAVGSRQGKFLVVDLLGQVILNLFTSILSFFEYFTCN
jgi:hypothetical protein